MLTVLHVIWLCLNGAHHHLVPTTVLPSHQVAASGAGSAISGYLSRCKKGKRHWKKLWFVIKGKVLYTYMASEVVVVRACSSPSCEGSKVKLKPENVHVGCAPHPVTSGQCEA